MLFRSPSMRRNSTRGMLSFGPDARYATDFPSGEMVGNSSVPAARVSCVFDVSTAAAPSLSPKCLAYLVRSHEKTDLFMSIFPGDFAGDRDRDRVVRLKRQLAWAKKLLARLANAHWAPVKCQAQQVLQQRYRAKNGRPRCALCPCRASMLALLRCTVPARTDNGYENGSRLAG